jgi:hypothetical protein
VWRIVQVFTAIIVTLFVAIPPVREYVRKTSALFYASAVFLIVVTMFLVCCDELRRLHPFNMIMLGLFVRTGARGCLAAAWRRRSRALCCCRRSPSLYS